ncbi:HTH-type transcriptional regulator SinR [mine drainage metagenome]|uniref:HTH-type transcriptional regulator SinR n=1 Tax=mine drainage metagenome TaxID=410659 RepID=A0A1J5RVS2_9ZZZZ
MDIREVLARNLRIYRQERGLSQEELAHRADLDRTYISALERCVYAASIDVLEKLASALNVEPADLLRRTLSPGRDSTAEG